MRKHERVWLLFAASHLCAYAGSLSTHTLEPIALYTCSAGCFVSALLAMFKA